MDKEGKAKVNELINQAKSTATITKEALADEALKAKQQAKTTLGPALTSTIQQAKVLTSNLTDKAIEIAGKTHTAAKDIASKANERVRRATIERLDVLKGVNRSKNPDSSDDAELQGSAVENIKAIGTIYANAGVAKAKVYHGMAKDAASSALEGYRIKLCAVPADSDRIKDDIVFVEKDDNNAKTSEKKENQSATSRKG